MSEFLTTAVDAALMAGKLLRENFEKPLEVDAMQAHDIKLELDRRTQRLIEDHILARHPGLRPDPHAGASAHLEVARRCGTAQVVLSAGRKFPLNSAASRCILLMSRMTNGGASVSTGD